MARKKREQSGDMEDDAAQIQVRRENLGVTKAELAREAGVSRTTLTDIEAGKGFQRSTFVRIDRALRKLEEEYGHNAPPPPQPSAQENRIAFEVELPDGRIARIVTRGDAPPEETAAQVALLLERLGIVERPDQ